MTLRTAKHLKWTIILLCTLAAGGCLSKEESESGSGGGEPGAQNTPPIISGNPQTAVMMGDHYSFTPSASDPDGDPLIFRISNIPSWASFDSSTGILSGQPSLADVGTYSNVMVSVSDGVASASLPGFDLTVTQAALGSMTLSWTPPTENTDGSALTDLSGYRIYYGISEGSYPNRVDVDSAGISTYVIDNLLPNTYYVVATSLNSAGIESEYSNVAIKTVEGG